MVRIKLKHSVLLFLLITSQILFAQRHLISNVSINRSSVFVGQPVEVSVSVYTSTWFTAGVNPGNIKVNGAFIVYFRSLSNSKKINGQTYAGVTMYFYVFPYDDHDIEFPSLDIHVETPNVDDYKGVKHIVKTKARTIKVKPVPPNMNKEDWLVTSWMSVYENWSGDLKNVKVGDVIERKITRNVSGSVSELIPPIIWDTIQNVSLYPTRSSVKNNKSKTAISATRNEGIRYLFEQEGKVVIPKMELTWWNPYRNKLYKKTLAAVEIDVQENPDLGMLTSIKKKLEAAIIEEEKPAEIAFSVFGLTLKEFILYLSFFIVVLIVLFKIIKRLYLFLKRRKANYRNSEKYYFDLFLNSINSKDSVKIENALYRWIDMLQLAEPTIQFFTKTYGVQNMMKGNLFHKKDWIAARKRFLHLSKNQIRSTSIEWVNP